MKKRIIISESEKYDILRSHINEGYKTLVNEAAPPKPTPSPKPSFVIPPPNIYKTDDEGNEIKITPSDTTSVVNRTNAENTAVYTAYRNEQIKKETEFCKTIFTEDSLKKAKDWWINWLSSPKTIEKYAKNFNVDLATAKTRMERNKNIIKNLTFFYEKRQPPYYKMSDRWVAMFSKDNPKYIQVNCPEIFNSKNNYDKGFNSIGVIVHEMQHAIHRLGWILHPEDKLKKDFKHIPEKSADKTLPTGRLDDSLRKDFKENGYPEEWVDDYYDLFTENKGNYITKPSEILSRVEAMRSILNKNVGDRITKKEFLGLLVNGDPNAYHAFFSILSTKMTIDQMLNMYEQYAANKTNQKNQIPYSDSYS